MSPSIAISITHLLFLRQNSGFGQKGKDDNMSDSGHFHSALMKFSFSLFKKKLTTFY